MNSFNHYTYGAVGEWMFRTVAGIVTGEPGYRLIRFKPRPGGSLTQASASIRTPHGRVAIRWCLTQHQLDLELEVPEECAAILDVAGQPEQRLTSGKHAMTLACV